MAKRTWMEAIMKDMIVLHVTKKRPLNRAEWKKRIHVANPKMWEKGLQFVVVVEIVYNGNCKLGPKKLDAWIPCSILLSPKA